MNRADTKVPAALNSVIEERGPWPFITWRRTSSSNGDDRIWTSRHHRKGFHPIRQNWARPLSRFIRKSIWNPRSLNWWIGSIFAIGASGFILASLFCLVPSLGQTFNFDALQINALFFAGSVPFTTAAYLQLFQAANAPPDDGTDATSSNHTKVLFGWRPHDIGWLSSAFQFVGTVLFNFNTFDAMIPSLNWFEQDLVIWVPNFVGSVLFLASGYLAFIETCHRHWRWKPNSLSWWIVFINLIGCIGFMASAMTAFFLPRDLPTSVIEFSIACTLAGACCFLLGGLLMLPESAIGEQ